MLYLLTNYSLRLGDTLLVKIEFLSAHVIRFLIIGEAIVRSSKLRFAIDEYTVRAIHTGHAR